MRRKFLIVLSCLAFFSAFFLFSAAIGNAAEIRVPMTLINNQGAVREAGSVTLVDSGDGVDVKTALRGLPPGPHGFHVHVNPNCSPGPEDGKGETAGMAAGGHYDPKNAEKHLGPGGGGHAGDLPLLKIDKSGESNAILHVPGVTVADFMGRSLIIHANGDNYSDEPAPLGGGGSRIACGVIQKMP